MSNAPAAKLAWMLTTVLTAPAGSTSQLAEITPIRPRSRTRHTLEHCGEMTLTGKPNSRSDVSDRIRSRT
jgi:hypothetical protein